MDFRDPWRWGRAADGDRSRSGSKGLQDQILKSSWLAESGHEEIMRCRNILANENRDETWDFVHT